MKTLAILLLAALSLTTACATDDDSYGDGATGLRPGYKPPLDRTLPADPRPDDQERVDSADPGEVDDPGPGSGAMDLEDLLDGRFNVAKGEWAEDRLINGEPVTLIRNPKGIVDVLGPDGESIDQLGD